MVCILIENNSPETFSRKPSKNSHDQPTAQNAKIRIRSF
jgi:hypothetical protein